MGLELDADKAEDTLQGLIVMGVLVQEDPRNGRVEVRATAEKAKAWAEMLRKHLQDGRCEAGERRAKLITLEIVRKIEHFRNLGTKMKRCLKDNIGRTFDHNILGKTDIKCPLSTELTP